MVSSMTKKTILLAISLLVVVISLTGVALGAPPSAPTVSALTRYTPGFAGVPGKMTRDAAGNFYVTDFWGKGIVKLNRTGSKIGFIPTLGRPSAVEVLPDNRLVVAMAAPQPYVAFYVQSGTAPNITGSESTRFGDPSTPFYRPSAITVDAAGYIYVLDSGDAIGEGTCQAGPYTVTPTAYSGKVKVYSNTGAYSGYEFGDRTLTNCVTTGVTGGDEFRLKQPAGIAYEKASNRIVVADTGNGRLMYYTAYNGSSCSYSYKIGTVGIPVVTAVTANIRFSSPVDVEFEYDAGNVLQRIYVVEKARDEIQVLNAVAVTTTKLINISASGSSIALKFPNSVVFERTATTPSLQGVLYIDSAATSTAANILPISIDSGSVSTLSLSVSPAPPSIVTATPLAGGLNGTVSVSGTTVKCNINGGADVTAATTGTTWSISPFNLVPGTNLIRCYSLSSGAPVYAPDVSTYYTYTGSTTPAPTVDVVQPANGQVTKQTTVTVSGTSDSANATVEVVNALNSYTVYTTTNAAKTWSAEVTLAEGDNVIAATAWLPGTVESTPDTVTVKADFTDPSIVLAALDNNSTVTNALQNFDGIVTEANLDSIKVNGVVVPATAKVDLGNNKTYFSMPVMFLRGSNSVTVDVTDLAGNAVSVARTGLVFNPEKPGLMVALPADNSYLPGTTSSAANGTISAGAPFTSLTVNAAGASFNLAGTVWNTTSNFTVDSGIKGYQFTTVGGNPNVSEKRSIVSDAAYARLAISSPAADMATGTGTSPVTIQGSVAPGSPEPTISIDGGAPITLSSPANYNSTTGAFNYSLALSTEKVYRVKVNAGSVAAVRQIMYDTTPPEVTIQADSSATPSMISGSIEPSDKISAINATLGGAPVPIPLSAITFSPVAGAVNWQADLSSYTYDAISFDISDPAGNITNASVCILSASPGDVDSDGTVRLSDALVALRHVAGTEVINKSTNLDKFRRADVGPLVNGHAGCDGSIDISDAVLILSKSQGLITF